jgi:aryl sulfotransferase
MRRVAAFLEITREAGAFDAAVRHCSFAHMRAHAAKCVPRGGSFLKGGPHTFIHQGTNGRWRAVLSADDCRRYEAMAKERLGEPCARWLAEGGPLDQDASSHPSSPSHPDRARAPNPDTQSTGGPCPSSSPQ